MQLVQRAQKPKTLFPPLSRIQYCPLCPRIGGPQCVRTNEAFRIDDSQMGGGSILDSPSIFAHGVRRQVGAAGEEEASATNTCWRQGDFENSQTHLSKYRVLNGYIFFFFF